MTAVEKTAKSASPCMLIGSTVGQAAAGRAAARTFVSHSSYCRYQLVNDQQAVYPTKYLISLTLGGLPPHTLNIKVGASVMQWHALRRYIVRHITAHIAYAENIQALLDEPVFTHGATGNCTSRRGVVEIHTVTQHIIKFCVHNRQTANAVYTEVYICIKVTKLHA